MIRTIPQSTKEGLNEDLEGYFRNSKDQYLIEGINYGSYPRKSGFGGLPIEYKQRMFT